MSAEITNKFTPCVPSQMLQALAYAWDKLFNETPSKESLCVLLAQWGLETGRGKYCHNWNIGNFKHVDGDGRDYCYYVCNEIIKGKEVWYHPDVESERPYCCFRAYNTIEAGAIDYLASLHDKFKKSWPAVLSGDPSDFAHQLKIQGYYTAVENDHTDPDTGEIIHGYKWSVCSLFKEFVKLDFDPQQDHDLDDQEKTQILALVALTSYMILNQEPEPEPDNVA